MYIYVCVCVCVCVCDVLVLRPLLIPYKGGRTQALSSEWKTDHADFTDCISFIRSNLMKKISPNTEALIANI